MTDISNMDRDLNIKYSHHNTVRELTYLPIDCIEIVIKYLEKKDIIQLLHTSKKTKKIVLDLLKIKSYNNDDYSINIYIPYVKYKNNICDYSEDFIDAIASLSELKFDMYNQSLLYTPNVYLMFKNMYVCKYITQFELYSSQVEKLFKKLIHFPNLKNINLMYTYIDDISVLSNCIFLEELRIDYTNIYDLSPLSKCTKLKKILMQSNRSKKYIDLEPLINCSLTYLDCRSNLLKSIEPLSKCVLLKHLELDKTNITDIEPLSSCLSLEILGLNETKVTNLHPLRNCLSLNTIFIYGIIITDTNSLSHLNIEYIQ